MGRRSSGNNRANQMNPNNDAYWQARGLPSRPRDWEHQSEKRAQDCKPGTGKGRGAKE